MFRWKLVIRRLIGLFLLATAALKLHALGTSSIAAGGWLGQAWVQLLAAEWEVVLGLWLISGAFPKSSWLAAVVTFMAFAAVSGYLGIAGADSCGCLGAVETSPWWAFGLDAFALLLLAAVRIREESTFALNGCRAAWVGTVAAVLAIATAAGAWLFGTPETAVARLRGETLSAANVDFGSGKPGDVLEAATTIRNNSDRAIRLLGGTSDCTCTTIRDLPVVIEPGDAALVNIQLRISADEQSQISRRVALRTNHPSQPMLKFRIQCRSSDSPHTFQRRMSWSHCSDSCPA